MQAFRKGCFEEFCESGLIHRDKNRQKQDFRSNQDQLNVSYIQILLLWSILVIVHYGDGCEQKREGDKHTDREEHNIDNHLKSIVAETFSD